MSLILWIILPLILAYNHGCLSQLAQSGLQDDNEFNVAVSISFTEEKPSFIAADWTANPGHHAQPVAKRKMITENVANSALPELFCLGKQRSYLFDDDGPLCYVPATIHCRNPRCRDYHSELHFATSVDCWGKIFHFNFFLMAE